VPKVRVPKVPESAGGRTLGTLGTFCTSGTVCTSGTLGTLGTFGTVGTLGTLFLSLAKLGESR